MTKYIIELEDDIQYLIINGRADNRCYTLVRPVAELEELNSDYINEHFSDMQDTAYQKGLKDGKNSIENGCKGCKYEDQHGYDEPCNECLYAHANHYTPIPKDDRIEVGDEVTHKSDSVVWKAVCIRIDGDRQHMNLMGDTGAVGYYPVDDFIKTGKHYNIASILEAMRK